MACKKKLEITEKTSNNIMVIDWLATLTNEYLSKKKQLLGHFIDLVSCIYMWGLVIKYAKPFSKVNS